MDINILYGFLIVLFSIIVIICGLIFFRIILILIIDKLSDKDYFCNEFPEEYNYHCFDCNVVDDNECRNCKYRFEGIDN